ncbi:hypothetical protein INT43_002421 [Umbelopsis isabellina]|uniref:histidine--tRNA ligase n=1 Tax=Mortierella isabellina TaxID=91625 RepID=A0A8H7Q652_MORIS|nr:hypothetical protein INT43_002421 [Umbelopsis isabellina]
MSKVNWLKKVIEARPVRGMRDRLGLDALKHNYICSVGQTVSKLYGFQPISTPILEHASVFERTLGEDSDIIGKELYTFLDKSNEQMTMRPEGTAGVARALLSNNLTNNLPKKWYYHGPMFRHERPQKGRFRQFEQMGVEYFGSRNQLADVEVIDMAATFLRKLGLHDKIELNINTLGDSASRLKYRSVLTDYLSKYKNDLSEDSVRRLSTNPLRILDSKHQKDIPIIADAPILTDYLTSDSQQRFEQMLANLESIDIPYKINSNLVRGLDYYQDTVFEYIYKPSEEDGDDSLGAQQGTVLAGGRYDGLIKLMSGGKSDVPGIGWAAGIDRLAMLLPNEPFENADRPVVIITIQDDDMACNQRIETRAAQIAKTLRTRHDIPTVIQHREDGPKTQRVDKLLSKVLKSSPGTRYVIFLGRDELDHDQNTINYRDLKQRTQSTSSITDVAASIKEQS